MFDLDDPPRYVLDQAPLRQALVQIRYPLQARLASLAGIGEFQDALGETFDLSENRELNLDAQFSPEGVVGEAHETVTWTFAPVAGPRIILTPSSLTLSVDGVDYRGVEVLESELRASVTILQSTLGISRCDRLGARYLSVAEITKDSEGDWAGWFRPEVIGWAGHKGVLESGVRLNLSMSQTMLDGGTFTDEVDAPYVRAVVRHGVVPAGTTIPGIPEVTTSAASVVLDLDFFVEGRQRLDADILAGQFHQLHADIDRFFAWSLTASGREHFGWSEQA